MSIESPPVAEEASVGAPGDGVDAIVCVRAPAAGLKSRLERLLAGLPHGSRLFVVYDEALGDRLAAKLERLAHDDERVALLRSSDPERSELACAALALGQARGRDKLIVGENTRTFPGLVASLRAVAAVDAGCAMVSPLSNLRRRARDASWQAALAVPRSLSPKSFAKLVNRVSLQAYPELWAPSSECTWISRTLEQEIGDLPEQSAALGEALGEYAARARVRGLTTRLADDAYVEVTRVDEASGAPLPERSEQAGEATFALAPQLSWHLRRGTAQNRSAPLIVLDRSPFSDEPLAEEGELASALAALGVRRAVLLYPAVGGSEIAEIIDGAWREPLLYAIDGLTPKGSLGQQTAELRGVLSELFRLFQIGWVHLQGIDVWAELVWPLLEASELPYCVSVDDETFADVEEQCMTHAALPSEVRALSPWPALFSGARRVLCASEATCRALVALGVKRKRCRMIVPGALTRAYASCAERVSDAAPRWLSRADLQRLGALRKEPGSAPLVRSRAGSLRPVPGVARPVLRRLRERIPELLRSVLKQSLRRR